MARKPTIAKPELTAAIYQIRNLKNGKIYIGSAKNFHSRKLKHLNFLKNGKHHCSHLQNAWNLDGAVNFQFEILELITDINILIVREQFYLDWFKSYNREIGYNLSPTAGNTLGTKRTPEQRLKLSKSQTGHKHTEETKLKWSEQRKGKIHSLETRTKLSQAHKEMSRWNCPDGSRCRCGKCLPLRLAERKKANKNYYEKTKNIL